MAIDKTLIVCSMYFVLGMLIEMLRENPRRAIRIGRKIAAAIGVLVFAVAFVLDCCGYTCPPDLIHQVRFAMSILFYLIVMEAAEWVRSERVKKLITTIGKHSYAYFLIHHAFLRRYVLHFSGIPMSGSNTLLMFVSSVAYIYVLAIVLDKIYAYLVSLVRKWIALKKPASAGNAAFKDVGRG